MDSLEFVVGLPVTGKLEVYAIISEGLKPPYATMYTALQKGCHIVLLQIRLS